MKYILKNILLILVLLIISSSLVELYAQTNKIDSLENLLQQHTSKDTIRVNLLNETANLFQDNQPEKLLKYAEEAGLIAEKLNYANGISRSIRLTGLYYWREQDSAKAMAHYEKSLKRLEELGDKKGVSDYYLNIGSFYFFQNEFQKTIEYFQKSLKVKKELGNKSEISESYHQLGNVYSYIGNYPKGLECRQNALEIRKELGDKRLIARSYNNLGISYDESGYYLKAIECYQKGVDICGEIDDRRAEGVLHHNIGNIYRFQNNYEKTLEHYKKARSLFDEIKNDYRLAEIYIDFGIIYRLKGDFNKAFDYYNKSLEINDIRSVETDAKSGYKRLKTIVYKELALLSFEQKKIKESYNYSNKAFLLANEVGKPKLIKESSEILAKSCEAMGFYKEAYKYHLVFKTMSDSLLNEDKIKEITGIEYQYKHEKKIELLNEKQKITDLKLRNETKLNYLFGIILIVMTVFVVFIIISRQKIKVREIEIRKLTQAIEQSSATIVITDAYGKIEYTNPFFTETTGYTKLQVKGLNSRILKSGHTTEEEYKELWNTISSGKTWQGEFLNIKRNKERYWEKTIISPVKNNKGAIINYVAVKEDITEKKKAEKALKESETQLKDAQRIAQLGSWVLDIQKNKLTWSDEIYRIFDLKPQEFEATYEAFLDNIHPDDREKVNEAYTNSLKTKLPYEIEHRLLLKNGELKNVKEKCKTEFDKSGKPLFSYGIVIDITKEKKIEEQLRKAKRLAEESNKTKDKFFSIIAHDLRNPFNALIGFSDILLSSHKSFDEEKRDSFINSINISAKSAFKLLENLLTWSRSQAGAINYSPEELHLKILLFESMFDLQGQANKKNIKIIDNILENELIFADRNMIATILRNLISNALKFTSKNGTVTVSAEKQASNNFIEISVKDTGEGISPERINDLFRIDKNTSTQGTENETGTGLGLVLCKEFTEKHNGKIWVESEIGKGSSFNFTVPSKSK